MQRPIQHRANPFRRPRRMDHRGRPLAVSVQNPIGIDLRIGAKDRLDFPNPIRTHPIRLETQVRNFRTPVDSSPEAALQGIVGNPLAQIQYAIRVSPRIRRPRTPLAVVELDLSETDHIDIRELVNRTPAALQPVRMHDVIRIDEAKPLARRNFQAAVPRRPLSSILLVDDMES